ncbi:MAG: hypothetical protein A2Y14_01610 [Verrucomicrobia bacterium GWF2_51_19]|nr:MAG: hypothetical protein A2Y14_01610 [Verrucomicrobia bacterium GWF2_51_19]HCJ11556.1 sugar kinase [Opitutae bacterium]
MSEGLVIVGSVARDSVITAEGSRERVLGGSAAYASIAASFFCTPQLVGVVGNDFPFQDIERFNEKGIDLDGLKIDDGRPTFFWKGEYSADFTHRKTLEIALNSFESFDPHLTPDQKNVGCLFLANISPKLQLSVLRQFTKKPFVVGDTIDLWIQQDRSTLLDVIRMADLWVVNESEVRLLTGDTSLYKAGRKLLDMGCRRLIVKRGEHGATLFQDNHYFSLPAYPTLDIKDPTGAGDVFAGALIGFLASREKEPKSFELIKHGMVWGSVLASFVIEDFSCNRLFEINFNDIKGRCRTLLEMISVKNMLA